MPRPLQNCKPLLAALGCAAALLALPARAQSDAQRMASGQWRDPNTGLVWMRCSVGQHWTGSTCSGQPLLLSWDDARAYPAPFNQQVALGGHRNWRLPTIAELASLRRCSTGWAQDADKGQASTSEIPDNKGTRQVPWHCADGSREPTWNTSVFPAQPAQPYWSSTLNTGYEDDVWVVHFSSYGGVGLANRSSPSGEGYTTHAVRLVRTGP